MPGLWPRWSVRDLRARWLKVAAIALIIALGTGSYAGLTSTSEWRQRSNEASYELTNVFDVRAQLSAGSFVPAGTLLAALDGLDEAAAIEVAEERLVVPTPVEVRAAAEEVLVAGRLTGVDLTAGGPHVNGLLAHEGRLLEAADSGAPVVVLESNFANHYGLPAEGTSRLAGGREVGYVGQVAAPEYFIVATADGDSTRPPPPASRSSSARSRPRSSSPGGPGRSTTCCSRSPRADVDRLAEDLELVVCAEPEVGVLALRGGVDPARLVATERPLLVVAGHDVLAELRPHRLKPVAGAPHDREVAPDRVLALHEVDGRQHARGEPDRRQQRDLQQAWHHRTPSWR